MITNPVSGGIDKSDFIEATALYAAKENLNYVLYETTGNDDSKKIKEIYNTFKPERIIIAGGDGTIKLVVEALENVEVVFGILPAGSANGLATDLNLPKTIDENLTICFHNNFMEIDIIVINGQKSLHLSDLGLNASLIKNYENNALHGKWGYALQAFNTLIEREDPFNATITANGATFQCLAQMIVVANSQKYGTGVTINPNGVMNDGKFELVIIKNLDLLVFGKIITGNLPLNSEDIEIISTDSAVIKIDRPVSFQIDGEYYGLETELDISISAQKMRVAIP
tara:strand:- start:13802 stop:14653 length:852 start_codon:yes stop_codon:yes gene_type:complete